MKALKFLLAVASAVILSGWTLENKRDEYGIVAMPAFYSQELPGLTFTGKPTGRKEKHGYFTSMTFFERNTRGIYIFGIEKIRGNHYYDMMSANPYTSMPVKPGLYDLTSFTFMGIKHKYDGKKCGNISFSLGAKDLVILKGPKPARPITFKGTGILRRWDITDVFRFTNLPDGYKRYLKPGYSDVGDRKMKIVELKSDNPAAYAACIKKIEAKESAGAQKK